MKRILVLAAFLVTVIFCVSVNADEMKIAMDGEVKLAKEIGTGKGITFTLPDLENDEYFIYAIELAVFEKCSDDEHYHIYKDKNGNEFLETLSTEAKQPVDLMKYLIIAICVVLVCSAVVGGFFILKGGKKK